MGRNSNNGKTKFFPETRKSDVYASSVYSNPLANFNKPAKRSNKRKTSDYKKFKIGRNKQRDRNNTSKTKRNNLIMPKLNDSSTHSNGKSGSKYGMNKTLGNFGNGGKHSGLSKYDNLSNKYEKGIKKESKSGSNFWSNPMSYKGNKSRSPRQNRLNKLKSEGIRSKLERLGG